MRFRRCGAVGRCRRSVGRSLRSRAPDHVQPELGCLDPQLLEIIGLSLTVTLTAVVIATLFGFTIGGVLAVYRFPGRGAVAAILNAPMGLPPVVGGLIVYLLLSNAGPLGVLQLLYTPQAMIIAQVILVTPIIAALTRQTCEDLLEEYRDQLRSLGASSAEVVKTLLWDGRYRLITAVLAGFGRAIAEVGAIMIVGGNIDHVTRTMTTAIALETSKGCARRCRQPSFVAGSALLISYVAVAIEVALSLEDLDALFAPTGDHRPRTALFHVQPLIVSYKSAACPT